MKLILVLVIFAGFASSMNSGAEKKKMQEVLACVLSDTHTCMEQIVIEVPEELQQEGFQETKLDPAIEKDIVAFIMAGDFSDVDWLDETNDNTGNTWMEDIKEYQANH